MLTQMSAGLALLFVYLLIMLAIVHIKKDISIANFSWGGGCLLLTLYTFTLSSFHLRQIIVTGCVFIWCSRLAYYVWLRYKKGADPRYVAWLEYWENPFVAFLFSFRWIVILNGFFACTMAFAPMLVNSTLQQSPFNFLDTLGLLLWVFGFIFESISDFQLHQFKQKPENKGKILTTGLWRYSRHPNYFGEIVLWWGIYILALSVPCGWLGIITPGGITITLLFVTGIPWAEKQMSKVPGYEEYKKKTSILIPWFPKK